MHRCFTGVACTLLIGAGATAQVSLAPSFPFLTLSTDDHLGGAVAGIADFDGDGVRDVLVGSFLSSAGSTAFAGIARIYSGAAGTILRQYAGGATGDEFGAAVADAGDVDNDGKPDFIVGMPQSQSFLGVGGKVFVYSGATGATLHTIPSTAANARFGCSVAGLGDVNGDGFGDFVVGARTHLTRGRAFVLSGQTGAVIHMLSGSAQAREFGAAVGGAGDVNNDGVPDIVVGDPSDSTLIDTGGAAFVFSGATGALLHSSFGATEYGEQGSGVAGIGDINGDGFDDVAVGAPYEGPMYEGIVRVHSGQDWSILHTLTSDQPSSSVGLSVAGIGDATGDGVPDILAGAPDEEPSGSVKLYSGSTGALVRSVPGLWENGDFGAAVAGAGDLNGDGLADLLVGSPRERVNVDLNPSWFITGTARALLTQRSNPGACEGDINGDGVVDFLDLNALLGRYGVTCPAR